MDSNINMIQYYIQQYKVYNWIQYLKINNHWLDQTIVYIISSDLILLQWH